MTTTKYLSAEFSNLCLPDDKSFLLLSFSLNEAGGKRFEEEERRAGRSSVVAGSIFSHQGRFHYDL
jgi:hypothetical protein